MVTIQDAFNTYSVVARDMLLFGQTHEWAVALSAATQKVGDAIAEENGVTLGKARRLPRETVLGPKAEAAYREMCKLIERNGA